MEPDIKMLLDAWRKVLVENDRLTRENQHLKMLVDSVRLASEPTGLRPRDKYYEMGWNSALELAAFKLTHDFKSAFGEDTLASIAVYLKEMKK